MLSDRKKAKLLLKYVFNPTVVFFVYFIFIALFALIGKQIAGLYFFFLPWFILVVIVFYILLIINAFSLKNMTVPEKINHVLEHGTIYCLKKIYGKRRRICVN